MSLFKIFGASLLLLHNIQKYKLNQPAFYQIHLPSPYLPTLVDLPRFSQQKKQLMLLFT